MRQVAVLEAPNPAALGGTVPVYVLGMSHVSRASCEDIEALIRLVRPDVVAVELCKDRVSGLVTPGQVRACVK
jgi:pheromone shutdown protein TraB